MRAFAAGCVFVVSSGAGREVDWRTGTHGEGGEGRAAGGLLGRGEGHHGRALGRRGGDRAGAEGLGLADEGVFRIGFLVFHADDINGTASLIVKQF